MFFVTGPVTIKTSAWRVDFELASIAGAGVDFADRQAAAEPPPPRVADGCCEFGHRGIVEGRRRLGEWSAEQAFEKQLAHLDVLARVRTVERFVAEREIRDDIVFDRRLEQRPLKPRGIAQVAAFDQAVAQAKPDQNVAAKSLDDRHAFPRLSKSPCIRSQRAFGKSIKNLIDQRKRLLDLAYPDPDPRVDVALIQHRHFKAQNIIWRIGKGAPRVEGAAGGAADKTAGGILSGQCGLQHAGIDGAILQRSSVVVEFDQLRKALEDVFQRRLAALSPVNDAV